VDYRVNPELVEVPGGRGVSSISAGGEHSCLTTIDGLVYCWGNGESGSIGDGAKVDRVSPTKALLPSNEFAISVEAGVWHTCALMSSGTAYCWGAHPGADSSGTYSDYGYIHGVPYEIDTPGTLTVLEISSDWAHACAIFSDKNAYCWGTNDDGELGTGNYRNSDLPVQVGKFPESSSNFVYVLAWASLTIMIVMAALVPRIYPWEVMSKSSNNSSNKSDSNIIVVKCNRRYPFNYFNKSRFPALGNLEESFSDRAPGVVGQIRWAVVKIKPGEFRFISVHVSQEAAFRGVNKFLAGVKAATEAAKKAFEEAEKEKRSAAAKKAAETRRKNREKRALEKAAQEEKKKKSEAAKKAAETRRKNAAAKAKREAVAKKAAETRRKNAEQERKKEAFSRPMLQTKDVPNATLNRKEKAWKLNDGSCIRCNKRSSGMAFYWDIFPDLQLVLICDECAAKEEFVHADVIEEESGEELADLFMRSVGTSEKKSKRK